jgi:hypothetical protein
VNCVAEGTQQIVVATFCVVLDTNVMQYCCMLATATVIVSVLLQDGYCYCHCVSTVAGWLLLLSLCQYCCRMATATVIVSVLLQGGYCYCHCVSTVAGHFCCCLRHALVSSLHVLKLFEPCSDERLPFSTRC